jgi:hypothetical protein
MAERMAERPHFFARLAGCRAFAKVRYALGAEEIFKQLVLRATGSAGSYLFRVLRRLYQRRAGIGLTSVAATCPMLADAGIILVRFRTRALQSAFMVPRESSVKNVTPRAPTRTINAEAG